MSIVEPSDGSTIECPTTSQQCRFVVSVTLIAFVTPDDGVWCVRIDDVEVACQGDTTDRLEVGVSSSPSKKKIQAVLRSSERVVAQSAEIHISRVLI